jgi:hypothetical protein
VKNKMKIKTLTLAFALITLVLACEKKQPEPETPVDLTQQPADVLNANSGYSSVYDLVKNVAGVLGLSGDLDINEFTVESNGQLNMVYNFLIPYQQSSQYTNIRTSINLNNKEEITQPNYTASFMQSLSAIYNNAATILYKPYSNYAGIVKNSYYFSGEVSSTIGTELNFGNLDADMYYPQFNLGKVDNSQSLMQQTYISTGLQNPPNSTLYGCTAQTITFTNPSSSQIILGGMFDWKRTTLPVKTNAFLLRNDSMIVYNCNTSTIQKITGLAVAGLNTSNTVTSFRTYSANGNIVGLVFKETTSDKYWSYSYNFTTQMLTKGVENASLAYSAAGSDISCDEFGNMYYSGVAGNGSNTNGVSIYKKDASGTVSLVGADSFLKFGTISKLKYIDGKVYLVVKGAISGTSYKQLTFLRQN